MGKVSVGSETKKRNKKGRPSLSDLRMRKNTRRKTKSESDSDTDERIQKKIKLVKRIPESNSQSNSSSDIRRDEKQMVNDEKVTEALQGSPVEFGPTAPLPDKKLLVFILDRLQKKDTYGVFSEPVDTDELPDYLETIEYPMDFGTVRKKLDGESYSNLDDFESDVLLICANGMQYNAPDTVYYRQAKSIQEIAKRDFQNLKQVNDEGVPQPKIVRRGRPPNSMKKALGSPLERVGPESSSDATLATGGDNNSNTNNNNDNSAVGSNSYNLRKGLASLKFQAANAIFRASPQSRKDETYADYTTDWNSEFPASILKADAKHTKNQFSSDENRRTTYKRFHPSAHCHDSSSLTTHNGKVKQLIGVGLHSEHGYARSLARFAANLGPVVWKVASKKISSALPSGVNFGPGWIGENDALPPQPSVLPSNNLVHDNSSHFQEAQQKHLLHNRNGFNNLSGFDFATQSEILRAKLNMPAGQQSGSQESHPTAPNNSTPNQNMHVSSGKIPQSKAPPSEIVQSQVYMPYNGIIPVPPDLNVRFQAPGSPNSSFQPDLALQL